MITMQDHKSDYVSIEPEDLLCGDPVVLYQDSVSTYASPSLEEVMQDAWVASLPYKPKPRLNPSESVEAFIYQEAISSMSNLLMSECNLAFEQKSGRAKIASLLDVIDKFLGVQRFNEFIEFCKENDEHLADGIITCVSESMSNESIGKVSTFSDDQRDLSQVLNSHPPRSDDDVMANRKCVVHYEAPKKGEAIRFRTMKLNDEDYGPSTLAPDCYVRDVTLNDAVALTTTPHDFDITAALAAHKCADAPTYKELVPVRFEGWNV